MRRNFAIAAALLISVAPALAQVSQEPQQQKPQDAGSPPPVRPELRAARQAIRQACKEDIRALCSQSGGSQREGGAVMTCLRSHSDQVSQGCKESARQLRELWRGA